MFDGNFFFNAGSDSVSLEAETCATEAPARLGFLPRFRFRSPLLSSLEELTFLDFDLGLDVLMAVGSGLPVLVSFRVAVSAEESVLDELERLDSTRWLDSIGDSGLPASSRYRSN